MIEFLTLLLGLIVGSQPVEVAVGDGVAAVELRLDGRTIARREAPPWRFDCDLGRDLAPHELVAIARDAAGAELGRVRQWVNYARSSHEAAVVLEPARDAAGAAGPPRHGRVVWAAAGRRKPIAIQLAFDGQAVPVDGGGGFELPGYDLAEIHLLQAEVLFAEERTATAETVFGGVHGEQLTFSLTAVPLIVADGHELPAAAQLGGWLTAGGGETLTASPAAAEGSAVLIVRDNHVDGQLKRLTQRRRSQWFSKRGKVLADGDEALFVITTQLPQDPTGLFRTYAAEPGDVKAGLWSLLHHRYPKISQPGRQHLWWCTALAGKRVADSKRPRAVVLVLSKKPKDYSSLAFEQARSYLARLRVPLFVWAPEEETFSRLGVEPPALTRYGADGMGELFADIAASLAAQRMVWVEGEYLPDQIRLSDAAPDWVRLAR